MGEQHVGAGDRAVEDLPRPVKRHHRSHRAELLAALDVVEALQIAWVGGIREKAAVPERPGAPFAAALEPGDHSVAGNDLRGGCGDVGGPLVAHPRPVQPCLEFAVRPFPSERCRLHRLDGVAALPGHRQRGSERGAGVAGRRLDPDLVEGPLSPEAGVCHAVEGHTPGKGDPALPGPALEPPRQLEHHLLEADLDAGGEVGVLGPPFLAGPARFGEGLPVEGAGVEGPVGVGPDGLAELRQVHRLAVGREGHHLVLVG